MKYATPTALHILRYYDTIPPADVPTLHARVQSDILTECAFATALTYTNDPATMRKQCRKSLRLLEAARDRLRKEHELFQNNC